jgi:O-antigen/teichoic acid export membrane protein
VSEPRAAAMSGANLSKMMWTVGTFGASAGMKFALNVVLSWLLAPGILGVMVVVNAVRLGVELLTDVGIEQNVVHHADGDDRRFRDIAWTLQVSRGLMLSLVFAAAAPFLARLYGVDVRIFVLAACSPLIGALHSTAVFVLVKRMEVRRRNLFEIGCELLGFVVSIVLAVTLRSVWSLVFGLVATVGLRSALSYALPDARQRFAFDRTIVLRIIGFGKWIALTSFVMYAATNLDRLYLGRVTPLAVLGVYGIARAIAELPTTLARRISYQILFPALAGTGEDRGDLLRQLARSRSLFTLVVCAGLGTASSLADMLIGFVYDPRYAAAGWMLSILLLGGIFATLSNLNEALVLAAGRPAYSSIANVLRLATLAILLPLGFALYGFEGAVVAIALTELAQYCYTAIGVLRVGLGFWRQDIAAVLVALVCFTAVLLIRHAFGFGDPLRGMMSTV